MNKLYITTPLYYVNDKPHAGTAYSTILSDIHNRYAQFFSKETYFLTGVDEHGQKCQQVALSLKKDPQQHCDEMAEVFKKTWKSLNIGYNQFYRTSSSQHKKQVQKALQKLFDDGWIYSAVYEGWYCVSEEIFYQEKDLVNGLSPNGKPVTQIKEKNYFFKMSHFKTQLMDHLKKNPHFIFPSFRQNEVLGFLKKDLEDLCISRPKTRLQWGVTLPFDSDYVAYVWVDALLNYVFAINLWDESQQSPQFQDYWSSAIHIIGKDILVTHAVYWPCLLLALGLQLPKQIVSHGWLLNKDQKKMSKSEGDTLSPDEIVQDWGEDILRYYFAKAVRFGQDAFISKSLILKEYNQDLANNLGNLLQRVTTLLERVQDGKIPIPPKNDLPLQKQGIQLCQKVKTNIESFAFHSALFDITNYLNQANKYLEETEPWKLIKKDKEKTLEILYVALDVIRISTSLLQPVIPRSAQKILKRIGLQAQSFEQTQQTHQLPTGFKMIKQEAIFPRIQSL